jgi:hypothetical protein
VGNFGHTVHAPEGFHQHEVSQSPWGTSTPAAAEIKNKAKNASCSDSHGFFNTMM